MRTIYFFVTVFSVLVYWSYAHPVVAQYKKSPSAIPRLERQNIRYGVGNGGNYRPVPNYNNNLRTKPMVGVSNVGGNLSGGYGSATGIKSVQLSPQPSGVSRPVVGGIGAYSLGGKASGHGVYGPNFAFNAGAGAGAAALSRPGQPSLGAVVGGVRPQQQQNVVYRKPTNVGRPNVGYTFN